MRGRSPAALVAAAAAVLFWLFPPFLIVSGAVVALATLRRGPAEGALVVALAGLGAAGLTWLVLGAPWPMLVVLLSLGTTDLLFALDSIPATFGVTSEPYLVFAANAYLKSLDPEKAKPLFAEWATALDRGMAYERMGNVEQAIAEVCLGKQRKRPAVKPAVADEHQLARHGPPAAARRD